MHKRVPVTLACGDYDRTSALVSGEVDVEGVELTWLSLPVEETFFRMLRHREFDAAEMSLSSYVMTLERDAPFIAIPAFPSRAFRHNAIYVSADPRGPASGITGPADLAGRVAGLAEWQLTANVWIKGILDERHGVPVTALSYRTGGLHRPGRVAKLAHDPPPGVHIEPIPPGKTLAAMLAAGEIDVLYTPRVPGVVRRLFTDPRSEEERYFAATGIFPIMHVVVLRRDVYEQRPWLARSLYKAFEQARLAAVERLTETAANRYLLPWSYADVERTREVMGTDFWTYGLAGNEDTLRTFLRYAREQGLISGQPDPAALFAPETLEAYVI